MEQEGASNKTSVAKQKRGIKSTDSKNGEKKQNKGQSDEAGIPMNNAKQ